MSRRRRSGNFWVAISLLMAMVMAVTLLPSALQRWMPPWVLIVYLYWLFFTPLAWGIWGAWWTGLVAGAVIGGPLGLSALLYVLIAWLVLHNRRKIAHMVMSSRLCSMILLVMSFILLRDILMMVLGYSVSWAQLVEPMLGSLIVCPCVVLLLKLYQHKLHLVWRTNR